MLRLGIAVLGFILLAECWPPSKEHGLLLERLRRSPHYCGAEYPERTPTSPLTPPAPPVPLPPSMPLYPPPPFWPGHHHHHHRHHHGFEHPPKFDHLRDDQNNRPPCDTCKENGSNIAISKAKSETGNAVAIAISRSKPI